MLQYCKMHPVASKIILRGSHLTAYFCSVAATKKQKAIQLGVERSLTTISARRKSQPRPSTTLMVNVPHGGKSFQLKWKLGDSLKTLAEQNDELEEYIEGICGGNLSCSTCHVYIEQKEFQALLEDPAEAERDMLDLAYMPKDCSRLGCAIRLTHEMIEQKIPLEVTIPEGVNNNWI